MVVNLSLILPGGACFDCRQLDNLGSQNHQTGITPANNHFVNRRSFTLPGGDIHVKPFQVLLFQREFTGRNAVRLEELL